MHQVPKTMRDVSRGALSSITCDECQSSHLNMVRMRWLCQRLWALWSNDDVDGCRLRCDFHASRLGKDQIA